MTLELIGLEGIPLVKKGDNITKLILKALEEPNKSTRDGIVNAWVLHEGALGQEEVF